MTVFSLAYSNSFLSILASIYLLDLGTLTLSFGFNTTSSLTMPFMIEGF